MPDDMPERAMESHYADGMADKTIVQMVGAVLSIALPPTGGRENPIVTISRSYVDDAIIVQLLDSTVTVPAPEGYFSVGNYREPEDGTYRVYHNAVRIGRPDGSVTASNKREETG